MEEKIIKSLNSYRESINPDPAFLERSKPQVLSTSQVKSGFLGEWRRAMWENFKFTGALTAAGFVVIAIAITAVSFRGTDSAQGTTAVAKNLFLESQSVDFQIRLDEASYFSESAEKVAAVLDHVSQDPALKSGDQSEGNN